MTAAAFSALDMVGSFALGVLTCGTVGGIVLVVRYEAETVARVQARRDREGAEAALAAYRHSLWAPAYDVTGEIIPAVDDAEPAAITAEPHADDTPDETPTPDRLRAAVLLLVLAVPARAVDVWRSLLALLTDLRTGSQRDDTPGDLADPTPEETTMSGDPHEADDGMGCPQPTGPVKNRSWNTHTNLLPVVGYVPRHTAVDEPAERAELVGAVS